MKQRILKVHPHDNVMVALTDIQAGETVTYQGVNYEVNEFIPAKHKFAIVDLPQGAEVTMYGVLVGKAQSDIAAGGLISTKNLKHAAHGFTEGAHKTGWNSPD